MTAIKETIGRALQVIASIGEKHHVRSGFSIGAAESLPIPEGLCRDVCERFAGGVWRILQASQAKHTVEACLVWL
jgi:hypothetical protein